MDEPEVMTAVLLTGFGGPEKLELRHDVPLPRPGPGEVLVRVTAAGMNNTDINTRIGWYNSAVTSGTTAEGGTGGLGLADDAAGGWGGGIAFPRIQGADAVGRIAAVGPGVDARRIGERVICQPWRRDPAKPESLEGAGFQGSEVDGGFAQYLCLPAVDAVAVPEGVTLPDAALATLPCAGGTAMNMLLLAGAGPGDLALVTGASGGVGSFLVQILKALGAEVVAVAGPGKEAAVRALGADHVITRGDDLAAELAAATGRRALSLVADVVGGDAFPALIDALGRGGRYVVAGAIAGPIVALDLRTLYLQCLTFHGSTIYLPDTFPTLLGLVAEGRVVPTAAETWPLEEIHAAQAAFLEKRFVGNLVLIPPGAAEAEAGA
ncbi:MAG: zinc-binding dehydrogenase [Pseudomonadota bacterium]